MSKVRVHSMGHSSFYESCNNNKSGAVNTQLIHTCVWFLNEHAHQLPLLDLLVVAVRFMKTMQYT